MIIHKLIASNFIARVTTGIVLGLCFLFSFIYLPPIILSGIMFSILLVIIIFEWKQLFDISKPAFWLVMPLYPILPTLLLISMNQNPLYRPLVLMLIVIVSCHDSGSYFVGASIGNHKICPRISPGKSWEGFIGGFICACIGLWLLLYFMEKSTSLMFIMSFSFIVGSLSLFGDLFESWLKRRAHIKDTASFLPGHGGFLDRADGILCAVFFFYLFKNQLIVLFR